MHVAWEIKWTNSLKKVCKTNWVKSQVGKRSARPALIAIPAVDYSLKYISSLLET